MIIMTKPEFRHIVIVLDRSGSMISVKEDTEGGLAAFLDTQGQVAGRTTVSLCQFDDKYEVVFEARDLSQVPQFSLEPRGMTALLDAVGRTITTLGRQLAALPEDERPGEVIVVILTDGAENASREYSLPLVREMINHQQETYGWRFLFLGADQDAITVGGGMGIGREQTLSYSSRHTRAAFTAAGESIAVASVTGDYSFSDAQRDAVS